MCKLSGDDFFNVLTGWHLGASAHDTIAFLEMSETRRRLGACVRVRGTFRPQILTILSQSVTTTINFAK